MKENKVEKFIEFVEEMDMKNKLKLAIRICESVYSNIGYDRKEILTALYPLFENLDGEYKSFPVINSKYITFMMAKFMEMDMYEQNRVALYLFNTISFKMN